MSSSADKCVSDRPENNAKRRSHWIGFLSSRNSKTNLQMDRARREDWEKWDHLSSYHVYSQGYDNQNIQNGYWWQ